MTGGHRPRDGTATVLVVDDEPDVADLYTVWLEERYAVRTAYGAEEALRKADDAVDVTFLDRQMPGKSGDDVLAELRERGIDCRVVMVTAIDPDFDIVDMPFDDYLTKPVTMSDLRSVAEQMLTRKTYDEQIQEYFALASKKATLEAEKDPIELQESETYTELQSEVQSMAVETDRLAGELDHEEFESLFQEFPNG